MYFGSIVLLIDKTMVQRILYLLII